MSVVFISKLNTIRVFTENKSSQRKDRNCSTNTLWFLEIQHKDEASYVSDIRIHIIGPLSPDTRKNSGEVGG